MNLKRESKILEFQVLVELVIITYQLFHSKTALDLTRDSSAPGIFNRKCLIISDVYSSSTLQRVQAAEQPPQSDHCPCSLSSAGSPDIPPSSAEYKVC